MVVLDDLSTDVAPVAIVGAGSIGAGWAIVFATAGRPVRLQDTAPERLTTAPAEIRARLADLRVRAPRRGPGRYSGPDRRHA